MVKVQDSDSYGLKRLESKHARNAVIQKLAVDFNLTPLIAEAFFQQFSLYFEEHANVSRGGIRRWQEPAQYFLWFRSCGEL